MLRAGDGYYIPSAIEHSFHVSQKQDLEYLEVVSPPKTESETQALRALHS
jgi:mannose-6-phosphate isomerase-like protein (cupin superfamily)